MRKEYIKSGNSLVKIDGDVREIAKDLGEGKYEYGYLVQEGTIEVSRPKFNGVDDVVLNTFDEIDENDSIEKITTTDQDRKYCASYKESNIVYSRYDVDFSVEISTSLFDDVPVSTFDRDSEMKIKEIIEDLHPDVRYIGFESSYKSRGMQTPYIRGYGRVFRESDKEIWDLYNEVEDILWSVDNLGITPIRVYNEEYSHEDADILCVLPQKVSTPVNVMSCKESKIIQQFTSTLPDELQAIYGGKVFLDRTTWLCVGLSTPRSTKPELDITIK